MLIQLLKSKILRAEVTDVRIEYDGSLAIDSELMERVGIHEGEKILVGNFNNGDRFETYAIEAPAGSKTFSVNGAAARKAMVGDLIVVLAFGYFEASEAKGWKPKKITLAEKNYKITKET